MGQETYTIDELAHVTGLKPRTIRHYIQQQLLLGPDSLGRNATYNEKHRKRLEVIKEMRRRMFSIEDIRDAFRHAPLDEDIHLAIPTASGMSSIDDADDDSALEFVQEAQVSEPMAAYSPGGEKTSPSPSSTGPIEHLLQQLRILSGQRRVSRRTRGESWVRFAATPDLEIHVRGKVPEDQQKLFEQIADHIRHILLGGDPYA